MATITGVTAKTIQSELITLSYDDGTSTTLTVSVGDLVNISYVINGNLKTAIGKLSGINHSATRSMDGTQSKEFVFDCSVAYASSIVRVDAKDLRAIEPYVAP